MRPPKDLRCQECDGTGETECCECGQTVNCDECNDGIDPTIVDMLKFWEACKKRLGSMFHSPLVENGESMGMKSGDKQVYFREFLIGTESAVDDQGLTVLPDPLEWIDKTDQE